MVADFRPGQSPAFDPPMANAPVGTDLVSPFPKRDLAGFDGHEPREHRPLLVVTTDGRPRDHRTADGAFGRHLSSLHAANGLLFDRDEQRPAARRSRFVPSGVP